MTMLLAEFVRQSKNRVCKARRLRIVRDVMRSDHWTEARIDKWLKEQKLCQ